MLAIYYDRYRSRPTAVKSVFFWTPRSSTSARSLAILGNGELEGKRSGPGPAPAANFLPKATLWPACRASAGAFKAAEPNQLAGGARWSLLSRRNSESPALGSLAMRHYLPAQAGIRGRCGTLPARMGSAARSRREGKVLSLGNP